MREYQGYTLVREVAAGGMITLRADLSAPKVKAAVRNLSGAAVPKVREITLKKGHGAAWMSPDELLLFVPHESVQKNVETLSKALRDVHHLVADVSNMRAMFRVEGEKAREVLAKLSPTDLAPEQFTEGELRRTRLGQAAAAFWVEDNGITVIGFQSVAQYLFDLLRMSAVPGAEVGLWVRNTS